MPSEHSPGLQQQRGPVLPCRPDTGLYLPWQAKSSEAPSIPCGSARGPARLRLSCRGSRAELGPLSARALLTILCLEHLAALCFSMSWEEGSLPNLVQHNLRTTRAPLCKKDTELLESVQKKATNWVIVKVPSHPSCCTILCRSWIFWMAAAWWCTCKNCMFKNKIKRNCKYFECFRTTDAKLTASFTVHKKM